MNFHTVLNHPQFVRTRGTVLFHHGEGQTLVTSQVADIISAYQARATFNLIVVFYTDTLTVNTDVSETIFKKVKFFLNRNFDFIECKCTCRWNFVKFGYTFR
jgi:hypothetical protein